MFVDFRTIELEIAFRVAFVGQWNWSTAVMEALSKMAAMTSWSEHRGPTILSSGLALVPSRFAMLWYIAGWLVAGALQG